MVHTRSILYAIVLALSLAASQAWAQNQIHEKLFGQYVLRSSVANSLLIPEENLADESLVRTEKRGIIRIAVWKKGEQRTRSVPAEVQARAYDQFGSIRPISLSENRINGGVFYTGAFVFAPGEVLDFHISARPAGAEKNLEMTYQEKIRVDGNSP